MRKTDSAKALAQANAASLIKYRQVLLVASDRVRDQHPVKAWLYAAASKLLRKVPPPSQRGNLVSEIMALLSWLGLPAPPMSETEAHDRINDLAEDYSSAGMDPAEVLSTLRTAESAGLLDMLRRKRRRGRPITKRFLAVRAFDRWLMNPRKSWMQVTREVCDCGKSSHDSRCKDELLQLVKDLKAIFKKYQIPIPKRSATRTLS